MKNFYIGNKKLGKNQKCFVVAEISASHNKNLKHTLKLVRHVKKCGADAIKLQTYTADTITLKSNKNDFLIKKNSPWSSFKNLWNLYNKAALPWKWQKIIFREAKKINLSFFSSPFDESAVDFLERIGSQAYKIASPEINHIPLIKKVAKTKKPIIISTGLASKNEISNAVKVIRREKNNKIIILKCTSAYPSEYSDLNLKMINTFTKDFKTLVGFSDHTVGSLPASIAVSMGSCMIEKHIKLGSSKENVDNFFSSDVNEFKKMVDQIRSTERILGKKTYKIPKNSKKSLDGKRSIYAVRDIKKDEIFTKLNIKVIRPTYGISPIYFEKILGKKAKKKIALGSRIKLEYFN
jgi:pseudaminic acid synthase